MPEQSHSPVKVFLADDSFLIRERVAALLSASGVSVVGQAQTLQGAIDGILSTRPVVVVLDAQLEGGSGLQVMHDVHQTAPDIAFVVFSNNAGPAYRTRYLRDGAYRFLDKSTESEQLAQAVVNAAQQSTH
jgi:DNA-binding NarL/FixJ family response regulator